MKKKIIILVMGLPGSGKTTLAKILVKRLKAGWLNADKVRKKFNDWDFSKKGIIRQSRRMKSLTSSKKFSKFNYIIADFICPYEEGRKLFAADYTIWVNTIKNGRFPKMNKIFKEPTNFDFKVTSKNAKFWSENIIKKLTKYKWNNKNLTGFMLGRFQPFHIGHKKLFQKALQKVEQIIICVKDVHRIGDNPFSFKEVKNKIDKELYLQYGNRYKIILLPNITNIFYGRKVGYKIKRIDLPLTVQKISATNIRNRMRKKKIIK